jgi:hypothetical protein
MYFKPRSERLHSAKAKAYGNDQEDCQKWFHIERAMIIMGMKGPQPFDNRPHGLSEYWPFDDEAYLFRIKTFKIIAEVSPRRKGPKLDPDKMYRTALAALVARKLIQPKGGNWRTLPSPRQIAQVWYVIFEEEESHVNIKNRLKVVGRLCREFERCHITRDVYYFNKLGNALRAKYGK